VKWADTVFMSRWSSHKKIDVDQSKQLSLSLWSIHKLLMANRYT